MWDAKKTVESVVTSLFLGNGVLCILFEHDRKPYSEAAPYIPIIAPKLAESVWQVEPAMEASRPFGTYYYKRRFR